MIPVTGLNHAVLLIQDLERSLDFYMSQTQVNPNRLVLKGLLINFDEPYNRDRF